MFGRISSRLLLALLVTSSPFLNAQTDRASPAAARVRANEVSAPLSGSVPNPRPPLVFPSPIRTLGFGLSELVRASGMIFSGTVTRIEQRPAADAQAVETVLITFHVDNALRGVQGGSDLTISQWIGLWSSGQRYRIGERVFLFLYPRSKLGLTSSVAGPMGRFVVDPWGRILLSAQHVSAFRTDPVLGGKSRVRVSDFALAVRQAGEEE